MNALTISVTWDLTGGAKIRFRYNAGLVALLKDEVPWALRDYDAASKTWRISDDGAVKAFVQAAQRRGWTPVYNDTARQRARKGAQNVRTLAATQPWADALFDAVGPARHEAVFRALTRVLHPDVATGDTALMQELNRARGRRAAA